MNPFHPDDTTRADRDDDTADHETAADRAALRGLHEDALRWASRELDGELTPRERVLLDDHVAGCPPCALARRELAGIRATLHRDAPVRPPVGLVDRVVTRVLAAGAPDDVATPRPERAPLLRMVRRSAAVAAALLLLFGGVWLGRLPRQAFADVTPPSKSIDPALARALARWESAHSREPSFFELLLPASHGK